MVLFERVMRIYIYITGYLIRNKQAIDIDGLVEDDLLY